MHLRIGSLRFHSIGHLILNSILFFERYTGGKLLIINSKSQIINTAVYHILKTKYGVKREISFIESDFLYEIYCFINKVSKRIHFLSRFFVNIQWVHHETVHEENYGSKFRFYDPKSFSRLTVFKTPNYFESVLNAWLNKHNITGKFVCVYARDEVFHNGPADNPRNSSIDLLGPSINYLIEQGYWVVRMGRQQCKVSSRFESTLFIDFSDESEIDPILDIMLIKECHFLIGSNSGLMNVQLLFGTKMLLINWFPIGMRPFFENCNYIMKRIQKDQIEIPFNNLEKKLWLCEKNSEFEENGYEIVENSKDEILEFVKDQIDKDPSIGIDPARYAFIVSGGRSIINRKWYEKNNHLFE
jgi:putative glycosyltransferase (TIGR04372 family)